MSWGEEIIMLMLFMILVVTNRSIEQYRVVRSPMYVPRHTMGMIGIRMDMN